MEARSEFMLGQGNTPPNTWRNNNVVITSKQRNFDVITSKGRRFSRNNDVVIALCVCWDIESSIHFRTRAITRLCGVAPSCMKTGLSVLEVGKRCWTKISLRWRCTYIVPLHLPQLWGTDDSYLCPYCHRSPTLHHEFHDINSCLPSAAYMRHWIGSALVQIMACRLFGAKPLSKPIAGLFAIGLLGTNFSEIF